MQWPVVIVLVILCGGTGAGAQILDFTEENNPPELSDSNAVAARVDELKTELAQLLGLPQSSAASEDLVLRARINCRRIAIDLLERIESTRGNEAIVFLSMLRFIEGFPALDGTLERVIPDDQESHLEEARSALTRFNEQAMQRLAQVEVDDLASFDTSLRDVLYGLAEAVFLIEGETPASHWLFVTQRASAGDESDVPERLSLLEERVEAAAFEEASRRIMGTNLDFLRRGLSFEEFSPQVKPYLEALEKLVRFTETLSSANWIQPEDAVLYAARIRRAAEWFGDPARREQALTLIDRLDVSSEVFDSVSALTLQGFEPRPVLRAFVEAEALMDGDDAGEDGRDRLANLMELLKTMRRYRQLERAELTRELRQVRKALQDACENGEQTIIDSIDRLLTDPLARADPATSGLIRHQDDVITDLQRLNHVNEWIEIVRRIRPRSERPIVRRIRIVMEWLTEPARRNEAAAILDRFDSHLRRFERLPLEEQLNDATADLIKYTGGLHESLEEKIATVRTLWMEKLGSDLTGGEAGRQMELLERLCRAMRSVLQRGDLGRDTELLNRWSAWMLEPVVIDRPRRELPLRFKLAVAAVVNDELEDLVSQLELIERELPLVNFIGELVDARRIELEAFSAEPGGMFIALFGSPVMFGREVWLLDERETLALLCRYAAEREHAKVSGQVESARTIGDFINATVQRLQIRIESGS